MRYYRIYLMDKIVAHDYFGKERKVYDLFYEAMKAKSTEELSMLQKQIAYITRTIPVIKLQHLLHQILKNEYNHRIVKFTHMISLPHVKSEAMLTLAKDALHLQAKGHYEVETIFFEALRKYSPYFLAMDFENHRFGWLNPIKEHKYV